MVKQMIAGLALIFLIGALTGCGTNATTSATADETKAFRGTPPTERSKRLTQEALMKATEAQRRMQHPSGPGH